MEKMLISIVSILTLSSIYLEVSWVKASDGEIDERCKIDCACCKNQNCGPIGYFEDGNCYEGCIDGYRGGRCYQKCSYNCAQCVNDADICDTCYDGFYLGFNKDCTELCPSRCLSCSSYTVCTKCKDDYYNDNGSTDCRYRYCPLNCKCDQNTCVSCTAGYFNPGSNCEEVCPIKCFKCTSKDTCQTCKAGYYNGYERDNPQNPSLKNCVHQCRGECTSCLSFNNCTACQPGMFGPTCQERCSSGCYNNVCEKETGNCNCKQNFTGTDCKICIAGKFGSICEKNCSHFCKDKICDKKSGECNGCESETIIGQMCDTCMDSWYGEACELKCSNNCKDEKCERRTGTCNECKDNFDGQTCKKCVPGKYGNDCDKACPANCKNQLCYQETGHCISCSDNYDGDNCTNCMKGFYGPTCETDCSSNCLNNVCNRYDGKCNRGCKENYSGDKCCVNNLNCMTCLSNAECSKCKQRFFGTSCDHNCSVNCHNSCDISTGKCDSCKNQFFGDFCDLPCPTFCNQSTTKNKRLCERKNGKCLFGCVDGHYGDQCNDNCSSLCINNVCEQKTGRCSKGCNTKSSEPECETFTDEQISVPPEGGGVSVGPIVGAAVGAVVLVVVVVLAIFLFKRRQANRSTEGKEVAVPKPKEEHTYGNITQGGSDTKKSKNANKKSLTMTDTAPPKPETRKSENEARNSHDIASSSVVDINEVEMQETNEKINTDDTYYNISKSPYRIKVENLLKYVTSGKVDFEAEFKKLNKDLDLTKHCSVAKDPLNLPLNRYNGIYPYDHSRVTIQEVPDFFINACYIDGYRKEKEYIASLGPTSKTTANFSSFWLMVWYKKTDIIVMLTNLRETSGMKCEQYWPEVETKAVYGDIKVKCRSIEEFAEYTVRTCTISKDKEERQIIQLHFTAWPDKGVPNEVTSLVEFRQRVKAVPKVLGGPIIVHCSAGIGRTGTYIGLDILTQEGQEKGSVDVFRCVNKMRSQRVQMVQTHAQYQFLHKALVHSLTFGCETLSAEEIQKMMYEADDSTFMKIYKTLSQEVDIEHEDDMNAREDNKKRYKEKNRRQSNVPCDSSRVRLYLARQEGKHDYINAVFINSFRTKNLFIAAQTPLPKTIEDFLSMVFQQPTCCIVALENQSATGKDVGQYLPADNETYTFGNFAVTSSKYETKSQYILKKLTVKDYSKDQKKTVLHFQYTKWHAGRKVPDSAKDFVQFIKEVETCVNNDKEEDPNIIAHCLNGFERSGLFCIVYKLLEKLEAERQVSVVNVVRKIRTHRSQSITCMEQLKFCYECVSAYLEVYNTYSNFAT